jgi:hypothetical protein
MALISIGGAALPEPSSYAVSNSDMDSENTTRNAKGVLVRDRVRAKIYKIEVGWEGLTPARLKAITDAVAPAKVSVAFFDPTTGTASVTKQMYAGDRSARLNTHLSEPQRGKSRWDLSFSLVEF